VFLQFLDEFLVPVLKPGQVVLLDNAKAHKVEGVRERIEGAGARVLYLPPYSPDLNPIEMAWSKVKQFLRKAQARTVEALYEAIAQALQTLSPNDRLLQACWILYMIRMGTAIVEKNSQHEEGDHLIPQRPPSCPA
jgi:transposase